MAKFEMDTEFIAKLAEILEKTQLGEIEMADGERRIRVARPTVTYAAPAAIAAPTVAPMAVTASAAPNPSAPVAAADLAKHPGAVKSPMVGTAYLSPEPGKPHFVAVGKTVKEGDTLFIIEAMKTMNAITAPKGGTVREISVGDGTPVEFGQTLAVIV